MPNPDLPEKLRKLASVSQDAAELSWFFYLSGEGKERQAADELVDILLFQAKTGTMSPSELTRAGRS